MLKNVSCALAATVVAGAVFTFWPVPANAAPPATSKTKINYIVTPHPDDEFEGWSRIEKQASVYPVFIILTKGEGTGFGDGLGYQGSLGEEYPAGGTFPAARGSAELRAMRVSSWNRFLNLQAPGDGYLGLPNVVSTGSKSDGSYPYRVTVGSNSARVEFDAGDGFLNAQNVADMIQVTRVNVAPGRLPALPENDIIAPGYRNATDNSALLYDHVDHRAVHEALWNKDFGTPGHQYARTSHGDPDASSTLSVTTATYSATMSLSASCMRTGSLQKAYGWVAFNHPNSTNACPSSWDPSENDDHAIFSRNQSWWVRF